ncbi:hypothetical protein [Roseateles albus]|uniref:Uncharacterized protein n=1 Tax=Roseateles albus TaxID=2987525 RepID=A0ABT5KG49_9BURK|nr:hypothetical protein [Roseateles albus]MDC8772367.1 hypothetical protein [Roseateles albus]
MKHLLTLIFMPILMLAAPLLAQAHSVDVPHSHGHLGLHFGQLFSDLLQALSNLDHWLVLLCFGLALGLGLRRWIRARRA